MERPGKIVAREELRQKVWPSSTSIMGSNDPTTCRVTSKQEVDFPIAESWELIGSSTQARL
mgnify:CR=1 FL=1